MANVAVLLYNVNVKFCVVYMKLQFSNGFFTGLLKLPLRGFSHVDGNFRFLNQIEEIWFDDDIQSPGQVNDIPAWVKNMESLQWIR